MNRITLILVAGVLVVLSTTQSTVASAQNAATNAATVACAPQTDRERRAERFRNDFMEYERLNFASAWTRGIGDMLRNDTLSRKCAPETARSGGEVKEDSSGHRTTARVTR